MRLMGCTSVAQAVQVEAGGLGTRTALAMPIEWANKVGIWSSFAYFVFDQIVLS